MLNTSQTADLTAAIETLLSGKMTGTVVVVLPANFATATAPQAPQQVDLRAWKPVSAPRAFDAPFTEIRVVCDTHLTDDDVSQLSGCLGYALTETVKGENLSDPVVSRLADAGIEFTVLGYTWSSDWCIRTDPDFAHAFEVAAAYVFEGTRIRTTDLAGPGTRFTRLVEGIGEGRCNVAFYVR